MGFSFHSNWEPLNGFENRIYMISVMFNRVALSIIGEKIDFKGQGRSKDTSEWAFAVIYVI